MSDRCSQQLEGSPYPARLCNGRPITSCFTCDFSPVLECEKTNRRPSWPATGPIDDWCPLPKQESKREDQD